MTSTIKRLTEPRDPHAWRRILGTMAVAWGTGTLARTSVDLQKNISGYEEILAGLESRVVHTRGELATAHAQLGQAQDALRAEVTAAIARGYLDEHVQARASALGWVPLHSDTPAPAPQ